MPKKMLHVFIVRSTTNSVLDSMYNIGRVECENGLFCLLTTHFSRRWGTKGQISCLHLRNLAREQEMRRKRPLSLSTLQMLKGKWLGECDALLLNVTPIVPQSQMSSRWMSTKSYNKFELQMNHVVTWNQWKWTAVFSVLLFGFNVNCIWYDWKMIGECLVRYLWRRKKQKLG